MAATGGAQKWDVARGAVRSHYFMKCERKMVDSESCPNSNTIPVWLLDMTQKQAGLFCLDAETTGQLIQDGQCKDDKDQLIFAQAYYFHQYLIHLNIL